jgi:hypothetical protein
MQYGEVVLGRRSSQGFKPVPVLKALADPGSDRDRDLGAAVARHALLALLCRDR